jgi:hypothetical protein
VSTASRPDLAAQREALRLPIPEIVKQLVGLIGRVIRFGVQRATGAAGRLRSVCVMAPIPVFPDCPGDRLLALCNLQLQLAFGFLHLAWPTR